MEALETARTAARLAGRIQLEGLGTSHRIDHKGRYDLVTEVDRKCERAIAEVLQQAFPKTGILAEEAIRRSTGAEQVWIVDPLDGTTNYTHGYPAFCTSIALRKQGQVELGVVYDPVRDELFEAVRGRGARLNGSPIRVSDTRELGASLLATGFPYDRCEQSETNLDRFCLMTLRTRGVRRGGSAAMDLCYTACGRLDGYWEIHLHPWDVSAGALIVQEAGGKLSGLSGDPFDWNGAEFLASNGLLHEILLESLSDLGRPAPGFG